jgi:hypothetical protein
MTTEAENNLIKEIVSRYGNIIDLERSPALLAEILRLYGARFAGGTPLQAGCPTGVMSGLSGVGSTTSGTGGTGGTGGSGGSPTSTSGGGFSPGDIFDQALKDILQFQSDIMRGISQIESTLKQISSQLGELPKSGS